MGSFSIWHWLIVLAVVLVLFGGGGKLSRLMGDFGKGLKSFRKNMGEESGGAENSDDDTNDSTVQLNESVPTQAKKTKTNKAG